MQLGKASRLQKLADVIFACVAIKARLLQDLSRSGYLRQLARRACSSSILKTDLSQIRRGGLRLRGGA